MDAWSQSESCEWSSDHRCSRVFWEAWNKKHAAIIIRLCCGQITLLLWHVFPPFAYMWQWCCKEWNCEVIWDVWLDLLRICMDTCSGKGKFIGSCAVGPKCLRPVLKNASILQCFFFFFYRTQKKCLNRKINFCMYFWFNGSITQILGHGHFQKTVENFCAFETMLHEVFKKKFWIICFKLVSNWSSHV